MTDSSESTPAQCDAHLSQITTTWTALLQAHSGPPESAKAAQVRLLERYSAAIFRYLLAAVRTQDVADDLFQEFALRFVRGDFKHADPARGRFRDFLKTSLVHLVIDHRRRQQHRPATLEGEVPDRTIDKSLQIDSDQQFLAIWRAELMNRAWDSLLQFERQTGQPAYTLLRYRTDHPEMKSAQLAEQIGSQLQRSVTAQWVRKQLHLARQNFTGFLVDEVAGSLGNPTNEELEEELISLGLQTYCRGALAQRGLRS